MPYVIQIFLKDRLSLYPDDGLQISKAANSKKYPINEQYAVQIQLDFSDYNYIIRFPWKFCLSINYKL